MSLISVDTIRVKAQADAARIAELKVFLRETDYVALSDYDKVKPDVIAQRATWRAEIRELEARVAALEA